MPSASDETTVNRISDFTYGLYQWAAEGAKPEKIEALSAEYCAIVPLLEQSGVNVTALLGVIAHIHGTPAQSNRALDVIDAVDAVCQTQNTGFFKSIPAEILQETLKRISGDKPASLGRIESRNWDVLIFREYTKDYLQELTDDDKKKTATRNDPWLKRYETNYAPIRLLLSQALISGKISAVDNPEILNAGRSLGASVTIEQGIPEGDIHFFETWLRKEKFSRHDPKTPIPHTVPEALAQLQETLEGKLDSGRQAVLMERLKGMTNEMLKPGQNR